MTEEAVGEIWSMKGMQLVIGCFEDGGMSPRAMGRRWPLETGSNEERGYLLELALPTPGFDSSESYVNLLTYRTKR